MFHRKSIKLYTNIYNFDNYVNFSYEWYIFMDYRNPMGVVIVIRS